MPPCRKQGRYPAHTGGAPCPFSSGGFARGELALAAALEELETRVVEVDPRLLANINRPQDLPWPEPGLFSPSRDILFDDG